MSDKLNILWTSDNAMTAEMMILMYAKNSVLYDNNWWDEITIIIWGPSAKLVAENEKIQKLIKRCMEAGVKFTACKSCAEKLGVVKELEDLEIEVKYWGVGLTDIIKNKENLITI